jgi:hypothetical protein
VPGLEEKVDQKQPLGDAQDEYKLATRSARGYGATLKKEIDEIIAVISSRPNLAGIIALLEELAKPRNAKFRQEFQRDPAAKLKQFGIARPGDFALQVDRLPAPKEYQAALDALNGGARFGPDFGALGVAKWLSTLGVWGW